MDTAFLVVVITSSGDRAIVDRNEILALLMELSLHINDTYLSAQTPRTRGVVRGAAAAAGQYWGSGMNCKNARNNFWYENSELN